jgi:hypothetical protein
MLGAWASFDISKLAGMKMNGPGNALLLRSDLGEVFEAFQWWFGATVRRANETDGTRWPVTFITSVQNEPDTYTVVSPLINTGFNGNTVTFVNHDNGPIDLPDPEILALHTAFARVFYASGVGKYYDLLRREMDTIRVLSADGSTDLDVNFLNAATQKLIVV